MPAVYTERLFKLYMYNEENQQHHKPHVHLWIHNQKYVLILDDLQKINDFLKKIVSKAERTRIVMVISFYQDDLINMFKNPKPDGTWEQLPTLDKNMQMCEDYEFLNENGIGEELGIIDIEPQDDYTMLIYDSEGNTRIFDFLPIITRESWGRPLKNIEYFKSAHLEKSFPQSIYWGNYNIDIYAGDILEGSEIL